MIVNKNVLRFLIFNFAIQTQGLKEQPSVNENNIIKETADAIRNTTNEIFVALKLKGIKNNPTLKQHSLIHNFFSTISLKDHETLNKIAAISKIDISNKNNETDTFLYEWLHEDPQNDTEESNNDNFIEHVTHFLTNLEYLKDSNGLNNGAILNINDKIINILENKSTNQLNVTHVYDLDKNDILLSDDEFWVPEQSGRRIFQGKRTKSKYFPFMASVQIFDNFQCGGSIIKSDLVITAASCVQLAWNNRFFRENPAFLSVRIGSNFHKGGGERIAVLEAYFHPEYNPKTLKNNICLLRLVKRIYFRKNSKSVKKIDFDRNPSNLPVTTDGITIVGWGATGSSNIIRNPWKNQLSFSVLDIYPIRECQDIYSKEYVTQKNFCAGFLSKGGGACNGDVGGPGIVSGTLAGVVSFGSPICGAPDAPTVFTKLGYYTDWIEEIMEQDVPHGYTRTTVRPSRILSTFTPKHLIKKTTFILEPLIGKKIKPIPINQPSPDEDTLRILEDDELFSEFLSTMFGSKEAKEYEELFDTHVTENVEEPDEVTEKTKHVKRPKSVMKRQKMETEEPDLFVTESFQTTQPYNKYTALDSHLMFDNSDMERVDSGDEGRKPDDKKLSDDELATNILKLIENIDMNSDKEESLRESSASARELVLNDESNIPTADRIKNIEKVREKPASAHKLVLNDESNIPAVDKIKNVEEVREKPASAHKLVLNDESNIPAADKIKNIEEVREKPASAHKLVLNDESNIPAADKIKNIEEVREVPASAHELVLKDETDLRTADKIKNIDDSILTLLYLSDSEKNANIGSIGKVFTDFDDSENEGLSIAMDGFDDLTFKNNVTESFSNFLPKDEMYDLLAEAIDEVAKNKEMK